MVFFIDKTICEEFSEREPKLSEIAFFEQMAIACRYGHCTLCGDLSSLIQLSTCLGGSCGQMYRSIAGRYAEQGAILSVVLTVFVLTFDTTSSSDNLPECLKSPVSKCEFIPIEIAQQWKTDGLCYLLSENINDCNFYGLIAENYKKRHNIRGLCIRFRQELGGGNTTCDALQNCVDRCKTPTLCIVDSDRKWGTTIDYPNKPKDGDTFQRVFATSKRLQTDSTLPPHFIYPLYIHEVENLIPLQVLENLQETSLPNIKLGLDKLKRLKEIKDGEPVLYYDFKKGFPIIKEAPQRTYWEEIHVDFLGGSAEEMPPSECPPEGVLLPQSVFPAVSSSHLLERACEYISSNIDLIQLDTYLLPFWESLGAILLTWGCADQPRLA